MGLQLNLKIIFCSHPGHIYENDSPGRNVQKNAKNIYLKGEMWSELLYISILQYWQNQGAESGREALFSLKRQVVIIQSPLPGVKSP
jgi:hypothetical protein